MHHSDFVMASGEMNEAEFTQFLAQTCQFLAQHSKAGSLHFICMDWRHVGELLAAGKQVYHELKNICVWAKDNAGMGSFYRSQHGFQARQQLASEQCSVGPLRTIPQQCLALSRSKLLLSFWRRGKSSRAPSYGEAGRTGCRRPPGLLCQRRSCARSFPGERYNRDRSATNWTALLRSGTRSFLRGHHRTTVARVYGRKGRSLTVRTQF